MKRSLAILSVITLVLSGCAGPGSYSLAPIDEGQLAAHLQDKPEELHPLFTMVFAGDERNHVLDRMRAGLAAMELGHDELAAQTFDEALLTIETMYGGSKEAAEARGLFTAEDRKVFRGEPYERAMAYYYRGILYLKEGDYENARASFKSGILQDTLAEQEEYRQDFALLEYLEGWASQCNGDMELAKEAYAQARSHNSALTVPDASDNLLVLAELGYAPVKYAAGAHDELLKIMSSEKAGPESASVHLDGRSRLLANGESILWQAMTRGGREFDAVLEGKAIFKESAEDVAEVARAVATGVTAGGVVQLGLGNRDVGGAMVGAGAVTGLISLVAGGVSRATETAADTRRWGNLPEKVAYGTYRNRRNHSVSIPDVKFDGDSENVRPAHRGGDEVCGVVWARSQDGVSGGDVRRRIVGKTYRGHYVFGGEYEEIEIFSFSRFGKYTPLFEGDTLHGGSYTINNWYVDGENIILREKFDGPVFESDFDGVGELRGDFLVIRGRFEGSSWGVLGGGSHDVVVHLEEVK